MPTLTKNDMKSDKAEISLITEGESLINARIMLTCPTCGYKRRFKNTFSRDKMGLVIVTLKIIDWLSCEICGDLLNSEVHFEI